MATRYLLLQAEKVLEPFAEIDVNLLTDPLHGPGAPLLNFEAERRERTHRDQTRFANPEETEALRENANLQHRTILNLLANRMRAQGWNPESNIFIDLCCRSPQSLLFEVKSCRPANLLSQVRKGLSQLYEYRYRHADLHNAELVLALETRPSGDLEWIIDYIMEDRSINICWLEGRG